MSSVRDQRAIDSYEKKLVTSVPLGMLYSRNSYASLLEEKIPGSPSSATTYTDSPTAKMLYTPMSTQNEALRSSTLRNVPVGPPLCAASQSSTPSKARRKVQSQEALDAFWGNTLQYIRSACKFVEDDGEDKDVELHGVTSYSILGVEHFYVTCKKGSKGKEYVTNQDAFSFCVLPSGLNIYVVCDGHGVASEKISEHLSRTLPYFIGQLTGDTKPLAGDTSGVSGQAPCAGERGLSRENIVLAFDRAHSELITYMTRNFTYLYFAGSTVNVVLVDEDSAKNETRIWSAHTGDSRTVSMLFKKSFELEETWVSEDHTPMRDEERIIQNGGEIIIETGECCGSEAFSDVERVYLLGEDYPGLRLGRAFGDLCCHSQNITTHEPDIHTITKRFGQIGLILIASDGVWEFLQTDDVVKKVANILKTRSKLKMPLQGGLVKIGSVVVSDAVEEWALRGTYCDDITCMMAFV
eukprot:GEMP01019784.1.p1 GENE.GEMP01019784.1~~GEMP01019784.1.p1  ORF type:complete len:467 (+),score=75.17 GEMP01019784.1:241-1641(+)